MPTWLRQFRLVCWKNFLMMKRRLVLTAIQIILPAIFIIILFILRQTIAPESFPEKLHKPISFAYDLIFFKDSQLYRNWGIGYTPKNKFTSFVIDDLRNKMSFRGASKIQVYRDAHNYSIFEDLYLSNDTIYLQTFVFIVFESVQKADGFDVTYSLRYPAEQHWKGGDQSNWLTDHWYPSEIKSSPRSSRDLGHITTPGYYREGFVLLQTIIDNAIIKYQYDQSLGTKDLPDKPVKLISFPYPSYVSDDYTVIIKSYMPLFIMVCFVVNATLVAVDVTLEKERKLKESMRLMGLKVWVNWLSWFLNHLVMMMISVMLMTFFFHLRTKQGSVFRLTDPSITFVFILLFAVSVIMFAFLMSSIFAKANAAAAATAIIYLLSYVPYYFIQIYYNGVGFPAKIIICLFNNIAMAFGCMQISKLETIGLGAQWDNIADPYLAQDQLTMSTVMFMLVVDIFLYALLTAYFDCLFPGEFGVPLPFYFPFTYWYWCGHSIEPFDNDNFDYGSLSDKFEKPDMIKRVGVRMRGLTKSFGKDTKPAVNNLNIDMYEGYITAFLGHNGAGKTTTMFMLTGFIKPTKGSAYISGYDISKHMKKVRSSLGLCPQHNILFNELTVYQHLEFFATLKGCSKEDARSQADGMVKQVGLEDKKDIPSKSLSGGMKRKLSIAIALIGGSKFVILDEPTSGMDPESRRQTWEVLQKMRGGRTIILSTHFMDEADLLGDRIAIMASGSIKCYGTPMFLKGKYGIGYHLTMTKNPDCKPQRLTDLITKHVTNSKFESELGTELTYLLPKEESKKIAKLFKVIEGEQEEYGVESFGVSVTTMEEVFIRVSEEQDEEDEENRRGDGEEREFNRFRRIDSGRYRGGNKGGEVVNGDGFRVGCGVGSVLGSENERSSGGVTMSFRNILGRPNLPFQLATADEFFEKLDKSNPHGEIEKEISRYKEFFNKDFTKNGFIKRKASQFISLLGKRVLNSVRDWRLVLFQILLPFIFTILACIAIYNMETQGNLPPLNIDFPQHTTPHWEDKYITPVLIDYGNLNRSSHLSWERCVSEVLGEDTRVVLLRRPNENFTQSFQLDEEILSGNFSVNHHLMAEAKKNIFKYKRNYLFGIEIDVKENKVEGFFQDEAYHAMPLSANKINNIRLCNYLSNKNQQPNTTFKSSITTFNSPLPWHRNKTLVGISMLNNITLSAGILSNSVAFGVSLMVGTFIIFLVTERHCGSKHSQYLSGADPILFWLTTFLWDAVNYLVPVISIVLVLVAFQTEGYYENLRYVVFLLLSYFWAMAGIIYCLSLVKMNPSNGYIIITVLNIFTGTVTSLTITIMKYPTFKISHVAFKLEWLFYALFPNFSLSKGLLDIFFNFQGLKICGAIEDSHLGAGLEKFCEGLKKDNQTFPCCLDNCGDLCLFNDEDYLLWSVPGIGRSLFFMALQGFLALVFLFAYEYLHRGVLLAVKRRRNYDRGSFKTIGVVNNNETSVRTSLTVLSDASIGKSTLGKSTIKDTFTFDSTPGISEPEEVDSDVFEEANRTLSLVTEDLESKSNSLVLRNVSKFYGPLLAVDNLCLTIQKGECFGLLGVNGAGKTTTFKMLVGEIVMERGEVFVDGQKWGQNNSSIGYCPQFDALVDQMTVRETLYFYASLRGIRYSELKEVVDSLVEIFLLSEHAHKKAANLSGGNKRKLGVAISLVGNPPIIFLDEPTTGMDPAARRKLWNVLTAVRETGKTIVLTSHSMEECEALCTRMAIMVNGSFQCLGSTQHLKSKFGGGFTVMLKMRANKKQDVVRYYAKCLMAFIDKMFPGNSLKDRHEGLLHYHISQPNLTWSRLFLALEKARDPFMLEDYSVAQTTLEELFISFAKKQHE